MATKFKGQGKGKKQVACTLPVTIFERLKALAEASGVTVSDYARKAIIQTVQQRIRFEEIEHSGAVGTIVVGTPIAEIPPKPDYQELTEMFSARATEEPEQTPKTRRKA